MGLPIWRDPAEETSKQNAVKRDATAAARSPIRRRPSVHGRRDRPRSQIPLDLVRRQPRLDRSPPRAFASSGIRQSRRAEHRGVPPVWTLLESADRPRSLARPPRPSAPFGEIHADLRDSPAREIDGHLPQAQQTGLSDEERRHIRRSTTPAGPRLTQSTTRSMHLQPPTWNSSPRPQSRDGTSSRRNALPTPPHDASEDPDSLFIPDHPETIGQLARRSLHPLRHSWRPESPINGLGDRNRSPTPGDGWETMLTTITPDATLPSAESSFTSAAVSHSFSSNGTTTSEPERLSSFNSSRVNSADDAESDSISSVDADDLVCNDDEREATASFAFDMYFRECNYPEGRERISRHREAHAVDGNRYALSGESEYVEIGFRLINEALDNVEGRDRVFRLSQSRTDPHVGNFEDWLFAQRRDRRRTRSRRDEEPSNSSSERYSRDVRSAVPEATPHVHEYFRRFPADELTESDARNRSSVSSPPPHYELEPLASHPDVNAFTSRDEPIPHPVSPPSARSERDVGDALLSGDEQDVHAIRRVVERLSQRRDVPDEWWMSLNLSRALPRTRTRSRSPTRLSPRPAGDGRVRTGRIERLSESPRL